jgi:hypothetical protein
MPKARDYNDLVSKVRRGVLDLMGNVEKFEGGEREKAIYCELVESVRAAFEDWQPKAVVLEGALENLDSEAEKLHEITSRLYYKGAAPVGWELEEMQSACDETSQSIAHLQIDLHECEQTADIKTIQHGLTQLENRIATVNGVIENVNSANVTRTSFAPVDIRSAIKPELENILGLIEDVRGLLSPPQVNLMKQSNVIRFNEAAQELGAAAKNLVAGLRSKVMIRPGLELDLPELEDPPTPAPSPRPISYPSETPPTRSRPHQMVLIAGVILAFCLSSLVVAISYQHQADGTQRSEQASTQDETNGKDQGPAQISTNRIEQAPALDETNGKDQGPAQISTNRIEQAPALDETNGKDQGPTQISTNRIEQAPAQDGAIQQNSTRVLAPASARAPRKTTLPLSAAHVRLIWSSNQAVTGNAYRTLGISSHDQCARRCRNDIRCEAIDYAKESETCRLFGSIERSDPSANSDYALKASVASTAAIGPSRRFKVGRFRAVADSR